MRRYLVLPLVFTALLASNNHTLQAQTLNLGPPVPLPVMPLDFSEPSVVALDDGRFVAMSRYWVTHRISAAPFATLSAEGDTVLAFWENPMSSWRSYVPMASSSEGFFYFAGTGLFQTIPGGVVARHLDPLQGDDGADSIAISPPAHKVGSAYHATRLTDGRYAATWTAYEQNGNDFDIIGSFVQVLSEDGHPEGDLLGVTPAAMFDRKVAARPDGGFVVAWLTDEEEPKLLARAFDSLGNGSAIQEAIGSGDMPFQFDLVGGDHGTLVVWRSSESGDTWLQRLNHQGQPLAERFLITEAGFAPRAAIDALGRTWVTWDSASGIAVRVLSANGSLSPSLAIPPQVDGGVQNRPHIVVNRDGRALVAWEEYDLDFENTLQARTVTVDASCMENDTMLCLHQDRFRVEVEWTDHGGDIGPGRVVPFQSSDSGLFWFFNEANWEVMVKVINGCDFNGFYWIFSAATTDVAYDLKVTDTVTGLEQIYSNGLGEPAPANTDTMALMSCDQGPP